MLKPLLNLNIQINVIYLYRFKYYSMELKNVFKTNDVLQ